MFKRTGGPVKIETLNFDKSSKNVVCQHCDEVVGKRNGKFTKFSGSNVVAVMASKFLCPKCGKATVL